MSVHDRWVKGKARTPAYGTGKRYEVRWREAGRGVKRRFDQRQQAEMFEAKRKVEPEVKLAAEGRRLTVDRMMQTWLDSKVGLEPKTLDAYRTDVREVLLEFSGRLAASLRPSEIRAWSGRDRGYWLRKRSLIALRGAYKAAQADGLLTVNPCAGLPLPKDAEKEPRFLSWAELARLASLVGDSAPLVWFLGTSGLRIGEAVGLKVGDVKAGRVRVSRAVKHATGGMFVGSTKGKKARDVPVLPFVQEMLNVKGRDPDEWLFLSATGGRVNANTWRRYQFTPAVKRAGLAPLRVHDLRHTAASLAIESGADVLVVQRMFGHSSEATTIRIYTHLRDARLDEVAAKMQQAYREATVPQLRLIEGA